MVWPRLRRIKKILSAVGRWKLRNAAIANKMARIGWVVVAKDLRYASGRVLGQSEDFQIYSYKWYRSPYMLLATEVSEETQLMRCREPRRE